MKRVLSPFIKSTLFTIVFHIIVVIFLYLVNDSFDVDDFINALIFSVSLTFFPSFLSFYFFDKDDKTIFNFFKPSIISFILIALIIHIYFTYIEINKYYGVLNVTSITKNFIAFFVAMFFTLFQRIIAKSKSIQNFNFRELKYSFFKLFLIPLSGILIYSIMMTIDRFNKHDLILLFYKFLPIGFIFSLISIHFFNYIFLKYEKNQRIKYIISYYVISVSVLVFWVIISYNNFRIVKDGLGAMLDRAFLIPSILLYTPFFLYVLILIHLYFLSLINKQEKSILTQQSLESQLNYQQLKNQISPHFLFNNINVLTSLIEENPKKAVHFSENLSHIYRYFLEQEKQDVVLVKDEINFAKSYLALLKDRFEIGLSFTFTIDEDSKEKYIVATILQQVLENVVKHNSINESNTVHINIKTKNNYLIVENNKKPKLESTSTSKKGIENIKKRMAFFTDEKVILKNTEKNFCIELPILETVV